MPIDPITIGAIGTGVQMIGQQGLNQQQFNQEQELMSIQHQNQQQLNQQGHNLQYDMWKKTNYPAQIEMMKEAGLNPALMYGSAGAGGQTGSQGGGAAAKGSAPQAWKPDMSTMLMGLEAKQLQQGIEGLELDNKDKQIEIDKKLGKDELGIGQLQKGKLDAETKKLLAEKTKLDNEAEIQEFEKRIKSAEADRTDKGMIKGDHLGNMLNAVGLDPVNNEGDRILLNTMLTTWFGSKIANEIMGSIPGLKELKNLIGKKGKVGY